MSSASDSTGDRLHRALCALRGEDVGLSHRQASTELMAVLPAVVRMAVNRSGKLADDVVDDLVARVGMELLQNPLYAGQHPGAAMSFVKHLATWRHLDALRAAGSEEPLSSLDDHPDASTTADHDEARATMRQLGRLYRVLLLLAGDSRKYRRVRAYLDHRLAITVEDPPTDRTTQNRLSQDRSTGRRYALELASQHADAFGDDDLPLLGRLLNDVAVSAATDAHRPDGEESP